jgi:hypothetical protein
MKRRLSDDSVEYFILLKAHKIRNTSFSVLSEEHSISQESEISKPKRKKLPAGQMFFDEDIYQAERDHLPFNDDREEEPDQEENIENNQKLNQEKEEQEIKSGEKAQQDQQDQQDQPREKKERKGIEKLEKLNAEGEENALPEININEKDNEDNDQEVKD